MRAYDDPCGVARALAAVGERWALLVVRELLLGPKRFADLSRGLPGMSPNVLTQRLRELETAGVLTRRTLGPPTSARVYELTDHGRQLDQVLLALARWGARTPLTSTAPLSVDALLLALRTTYAGGLHAAVELRLDGDRVTVTADPERLRVVRRAAARPAAVIDTDPATLRAVIFGGRPLADAVTAGQLTITGDHDLADRLLGAFRRPAPTVGAGPAAPAG